MAFPYYDPDSNERPRKQIELPITPLRTNLADFFDDSQDPTKHLAHRSHPSKYIPEPGLVAAANVALLLGQPLLLTGDPGTGKTQFAYSVAWKLGFGVPLKFEAKSTSVARDLFYTYDTVGRFHAAQTKEGSQAPLDYIIYNAFGEAILLAAERADVAKWLPKGFKHNGPRRSVVLIDEIDKTPRDFPNDILNEVEEMSFKVPELENVSIRAENAMRPVLIITSNSEKHLPDAFLRRCIYYHIPFPEGDDLRRIVERRFGPHIIFLHDALEFFVKLREDSRLARKPATAELLDWLAYLCERVTAGQNPFREKSECVTDSLSALTKSKEDHDFARRIWEEWQPENRQ